MRADEPGPVDELPAHEQNGGHDHHGVVREEGLNAPGGEAGVTVENDDEAHSGETDVGAVRLEPAGVGERVAVDSLGHTRVVEEDIGDTHDNEVDDAAGRDQVDQPRQDLVGAVAELEEGQEREAHHNHEAVDRHAILRALAQEPWCSSLNCQPVQTASRAVGVGVARGEDTCHHQCVRNVREDLDAQVAHRNDIRRRSSGATATSRAENDVDQCGIVVSNDDTNAQRAENEEDAESPVDGLERSLDVYPGPLGFGRNHRNILGTDDSEGGGPQCGEEALKPTQVSCCVVFGHWAGVPPVAESVGILFRVATAHGDEREGEQHKDQNDLSSGEPEFGFSVCLDGEDVEKTRI